MKFPGENSLITDINLQFNEISKNFKKPKISSKLIDKRFYLIDNNMFYKNHVIYFKTMKRPSITQNKLDLNNLQKKRICLLKQNVFILGASKGIGRDFYELIKTNKKIFKIATYYKNKIKDKNKKIIIKKIDIKKDFNKVKSLINKFTPLNFYYFPTPKILFSNKLNKRTVKEYKDYYINFPLKLLREFRNKKVRFFYPSTTNIYYNKRSIYSKIKQQGEKKIFSYCSKNKIPFVIHRFPAIKSKQSITLLNQLLPNLFNYLKANQKVFKKMILIE